MQRVEELMRSSQIVAGGFLGDDPRPLEEIIEDDVAAVEQLGTTCRAIAARMAELTGLARPGQGNFVPVSDTLTVAIDDNRGVLICPWGEKGRHGKTVTTARRLDTGREIRWSDLSVHFIGEHGFFQGRGSAFRLSPRELVEIVF